MGLPGNRFNSRAALTLALTAPVTSYGYITGAEAVDLNRITGIPMFYRGGAPSTHFGAVDQGVVPVEEVFYDLDRMDTWDRVRLGWARVGVWASLWYTMPQLVMPAIPKVDSLAWADYT